MKFTPTKIEGVWIVEVERHHDERGWFGRTWCSDEFKKSGLVSQFSQCSVSFNLRCGTLRGMHYQSAPYEEVKLVRCTRGKMFDVALDLRPDSRTFLRWVGTDLTQENGRSLYIPAGCAHGFQTLESNTEVFYQIAGQYQPGSGRGVRWDDPAFGIQWPEEPTRTISQRDQNYKFWPQTLPPLKP